MEKLKGYSEIGGYEVNYVLNGYVLHCSDCANKMIECGEYTKEDFNIYVHWEGDSEYCEKCNCEIESIY